MRNKKKTKNRMCNPQAARSLSDFVQFNARNRAKARFLPLKLRKEPRLSENFAVNNRKIPQARQAPRQFIVHCSLFTVLFLLLVPVYSQTASGAGEQDEFLPLIGITLNELFERYGLPQYVYSDRGEEVWQDDVVFAYAGADFYIFKDRVWKISVKSAYGINVGDNKTIAQLVLGETVQDYGDYILYSFAPGVWPLAMRLNINAGKIAAMFIYRSDF